MYTLEVESDFSAAHRLRGYRGKCENLHGHNWRVRAAVSGRKLDATGLLVDFGDLKRWLADCLSALDHQMLNEVRPFDRENPTSENLARHLALELGRRLPRGVRVRAITVWESDRCAATWEPPVRRGKEA